MLNGYGCVSLSNIPSSFFRLFFSFFFFFLFQVGWYRKHFSVPTEWKGQSISIYFEGIFHETTVWLNGKQVAFHDAGYTSWWLRIDTEDLQYGGENVLSAFVNASTGTGWW